MSAILDLLTRIVEEKGVSKMILGIKEEMEEIERIELIKNKFYDLLDYYSYYSIREDLSVIRDELKLPESEYECDEYDGEFQVSKEEYDEYDSATCHKHGNTDYESIFYHLGDDLEDLPEECLNDAGYLINPDFDYVKKYKSIFNEYDDFQCLELDETIDYMRSIGYEYV